LLAWVAWRCALPRAVSAHDDAEDVWTLDRWVIVPLLLSGCLYAQGTARLWRRSEGRTGISLIRATYYAAGCLSLAGALVSPLHLLG